MVSYAYRMLRGTEPKATLTLTEGEDYSLEEGAPVLTEGGFQRIGQAHSDGRDVVIKFDEIVIFRLPAKG
jgi:hypothetical protein